MRRRQWGGRCSERPDKSLPASRWPPTWLPDATGASRSSHLTRELVGRLGLEPST
jgi:hypothetical protein